MVFVEGPVEVAAPATSANLGPGFDCLGLALELHDTLIGEIAGVGLSVLVDGEGAVDVPCDERHLVVRAMREAFAAMGVRPPGMRLTCTNVIPHSRGLGSSSAAIVGGMVLARALVVEGRRLLPDQTVLELASRMEGHPDNVAPALLGGLVVCGQSARAAEVWATRAPLATGLAATLYVPPNGVPTAAARRLLPATVAHERAAANTARAALLVAALGGAPELLLRATEDFLHQSYRREVMPDTLALIEALRSSGVPAAISGAGPSVVALTGAGLPVADPAGVDLAGWQVLDLAVATRGAHPVRDRADA